MPPESLLVSAFHLPGVSHLLGKIQILSSFLLTVSSMIYLGRHLNFLWINPYFSVQWVSEKKTKSKHTNSYISSHSVDEIQSWFHVSLTHLCVNTYNAHMSMLPGNKWSLYIKSTEMLFFHPGASCKYFLNGITCSTVQLKGPYGSRSGPCCIKTSYTPVPHSDTWLIASSPEKKPEKAINKRTTSISEPL